MGCDLGLNPQALELSLHPRAHLTEARALSHSLSARHGGEGGTQGQGLRDRMRRKRLETVRRAGVGEVRGCTGMISGMCMGHYRNYSN